MHDSALQQTQLGTESGFQEAPTTESDELEQDQPNRQYRTQTPPLPSLQSPRVKPSNGHQTDEDVVKVVAVATKKSDWS